MEDAWLFIQKEYNGFRLSIENNSTLSNHNVHTTCIQIKWIDFYGQKILDV